MSTLTGNQIDSNPLRSLNPTAYAQTARDFLRYFEINIADKAGLEKLSAVLQAFVQIPYENLSKIIKFGREHQDVNSLRLPDEVWEDYRRHLLGGTCFSLTFLLRSIVETLGFASYPVMAHMKAGKNHHCALIVVFEGAHYLLDPGYVLDVPMRIDGEQRRLYRSAHAGVALKPANRDLHYHLHTFTRDQMQWRYTFADVPVADADFLQHWLDSFSWNGMNGLCLTKSRKDSLIFIHKHFMRETGISGKQNHNLKQNREHVIEQIFGIRPEIVEAAESAVQERLRRSRAQSNLK